LVQVVGHQHVFLQPAAHAHKRIAQPAAVGEPVVGVEEAGRAVMTALHDVSG
jgi:hypothetical protein